MYIPYFLHSSVCGHEGYFHTLTIMNNATVNIGVKISLQDSDFNYLRYIDPEVELLNYMAVLF